MPTSAATKLMRKVRGVDSAAKGTVKLTRPGHTLPAASGAPDGQALPPRRSTFRGRACGGADDGRRQGAKEMPPQGEEVADTRESRGTARNGAGGHVKRKAAPPIPPEQFKTRRTGTGRARSVE